MKSPDCQSCGPSDRCSRPAPPAFAYDSDLQDRICRTLSDILTQVPVWHLACLPDKAAAELSYATVLEGKQGA